MGQGTLSPLFLYYLMEASLDTHEAGAIFSHFTDKETVVEM